MSDLLDLLVAGVMLGPTVAAAIVFARAWTSGSYRQRATPSEMVFSPPTALIVGITTTVFSIVWASAVTIYLPGRFGVVGRLSFWTRPQTVGGFLGAALIVAAVCWLAVRWSWTSLSLVLNLDRRTYRFKRKTGAWDDFAGVGVGHVSGEGGTTHYVQLKWRGQAGPSANLGAFGLPGDAEAFAAQMARELGLPLVETHPLNI